MIGNWFRITVSHQFITSPFCILYFLNLTMFDKKLKGQALCNLSRLEQLSLETIYKNVSSIVHVISDVSFILIYIYKANIFSDYIFNWEFL